MPFHKLSQWLAYSLIEPLEDAGIEVVDLDALTALAEYRNGGLLIDSGVLVPKHVAVLEQAHRADSEIIVEWRALTVALIDRLADRVRDQLGLSLPNYRSPRSCKGAPGAPDAIWRGSCARTAVRRFASSATARCSKPGRAYWSASAATCILTILSGLAGGSPWAIASMCSMPSTTWPQTVYWPFRCGVSA